MAICTGDSIVQNIERTECIGNSLTKINNNFKNLDITSCELGNDVDGLSTLVSALQTTIIALTSSQAALFSSQSALSSMQTGFVGSVSYFPATTAPTGWLALYGQTISRSTYSSLWTFANSSGNIVTDTSWNSLSAYGSFGTGDGSSTFRLPDLRGYFVRNWDGGRGVDSGRLIGTQQSDDFRSHSHVLSNALQWPRSGSAVTEQNQGGGAEDYNGYVGSTNSAGGTETRPKNLSLLACIKF